MNSIKISDVIKIINPEYFYLKLTPNNSLRNNGTYKIANAIASLYKNVLENIKKEEIKLIEVLGRNFILGTKYSYNTGVKVSYFIYIEKKKVEFYFIVPKEYLGVIKERIGEVWSNITIDAVNSIPSFSDKAVKYQLVYQKEDALSLAIDKRNNDLLNSNLNVIDILNDGDKVGIFYNFIPISQFSWRSTYINTIKKVKNKTPVERNKFGISYLLKSAISIISILVNDIAAAFSSLNESKNEVLILENILEKINGTKISEATIKKGNNTILNTQILVICDSEDELRKQNISRSLSQSYNSIEEDNRLIAKKSKHEFNPLRHVLKGVEINKVSAGECSNFISIPGREILEKYKFIEKVETLETEVPEDLKKGVMCIGDNKFRGFEQRAYLSNDKEYKNLTLVLIGPTRAGKTTLLGNLSKDAINNNECVVVFDYIRNCELSEEIAELFPNYKVLRIDCGDFNKLQGLGYNEVGFSEDTFKRYDNAKRQTTQLLALINSVNTDDTHLTAKMDRYLISAALIVFINRGSIKDVFNVLQNNTIRWGFIEKIPKNQSDNLKEYIYNLHELDECNKEGIVIGTKEHLIVGIIDRLNKLKSNTYMELMLKKGIENNIDLSKEIQKPQLITLKMPESMFSTDNERDVYATYWLSKLWLALQVRSQITTGRDKLTKVNLIIDELYQVQNTEKYLTEKLSRLAKFGLKPIISCHYLNQIKQIREELRSANASYILISGCDKKNYLELKDELYPFELQDLLNLPRYHSMNLIKNNEGYARFITKLPKPIK